MDDGPHVLPQYKYVHGEERETNKMQLIWCLLSNLIINIRLVASCWFLPLHPVFMMHGHKNLKCTWWLCVEIAFVKDGIRCKSPVSYMTLSLHTEKHVAERWECRFSCTLLQKCMSGTSTWIFILCSVSKYSVYFQ